MKTSVSLAWDCGDFLKVLALYIGCHSPPRISEGTWMRFTIFWGVGRKTGDRECAGECLLEPSLMSIVELVELL